MTYEPQSSIEHAQFRASGFTWRVVFEKYTLPVPHSQKEAYSLLTEAQKAANLRSRKRCAFALRVKRDGDWRACAIGAYSPRDGCVPEPEIFREDIGGLDLTPVLAKAASLRDKATMTDFYYGGAECLNKTTKQRCRWCREVEEIMKKRAEADKKRATSEEDV